MSKKSNWTSVINTAKRYYKGSLTFTVTWSVGASGQGGPRRDSAGMDAYQGVNPPTPRPPRSSSTAGTAP